MADGEIEEGAGAGRRLGVALPVTETGDLGPHMGPVGDVVVGQRIGVRLTGELPVGGEEPVGGGGNPQALEVHGQEGDVGQDVAVAQAVVEFDAVEDARAVLEAEDVLRLQVAVAVAYATEGDPLIEQPVPPGQIAADELLHPFGDPGIEDGPDEGRQLAEVPLPVGLHRFPLPGRRDLLRGRRPGVEDRDPAGDLGEHVPERSTGPDQGGEAPLGRHAAHDDEMVTGDAVGPEDVGDAQVDVRGQPAVERHLPVAGLLPGLPGGEVQEPQCDRLLQLVDAVPDRHEDRNVRLGDGGTGRCAAQGVDPAGACSCSASTSWPGLHRPGS